MSTALAGNQWKKDMLDGWLSGKTLKCALFAGQNITQATATYAAVSAYEVEGAGYSAGGVTLASITTGIASNAAYVDAANAVFSAVTVSGVRQAMIYDSGSGRMVAYTTFDSDQSSNAADFTVTIPGATGNGFVALT